jgi:hypothetical protein
MCKENTNPYRERNALANAGTLAHDMIQHKVLGTSTEEIISVATCEESDDLTLSRATTSFKSFAQWVDEKGFEVVATELPLVHDAIGIGGTVDLVGKLDGKLFILDWKTSKTIYPNHLAQVSAYAYMVETGRLADEDAWPVDCLGEIVDEIYVVSANRDTGELACKCFPRDAWRYVFFPMFEAGLAAVRAEKTVEAFLKS